MICTYKYFMVNYLTQNNRLIWFLSLQISEEEIFQNVLEIPKIKDIFVNTIIQRSRWIVCNLDVANTVYPVH